MDCYSEVGYQNKAAAGGSIFNFVAPTFDKVDGSAMKLTDLKLEYDGDDQSVQNIWTLDKGGATKQNYYYINEHIANDIWGDPSAVGWWKDADATEPIGDVDIPYGSGFAVVSFNPINVVFSGAVQKEEATVDVEGGSIFVFTGNCIPVDYSLNDLALIYEGDDQSIQNVWTLDKGGATLQNYYYVNEHIAVDVWGDETAIGWWKDADATEPIEGDDIVMPAGRGFAIVSLNPIQLWVPSPLK